MNDGASHSRGSFVLSDLLHPARIGAVIANKVSAKTLNRATGVILVLLGVLVIGIGALI